MEAVADFNRRAKSNDVGKMQPPLSVQRVFQSIARTRAMPKGAYLQFIPGLAAVNGCDVDVWWIDLQAYPTDLTGAPQYTHRIRTVDVNSRQPEDR